MGINFVGAYREFGEPSEGSTRLFPNESARASAGMGDRVQVNGRTVDGHGLAVGTHDFMLGSPLMALRIINEGYRAPNWATALLSDVCTTFPVMWPYTIKLRWFRRHTTVTSTGSALDEVTPLEIRIHENPNDTMVERRWVVLHEAAHLIVGCEYGHTDRFFAMAYRLFSAWGLPLDWCIWRESTAATARRVAKEFGFGQLVEEIERAELKSEKDVLLGERLLSGYA